MMWRTQSCVPCRDSSRHLRANYACWLAAATVLLAAQAQAQVAARDFFDDRVIHDVWIDLDPNDWASLKQHYLEDTYYTAKLTVGLSAASNIGIRSHGSGSRSPEKPNLDVNIGKYKHQTIAGLSYFVLKANNQDPSMMHENVAFQLYRKMGLPAPREAPVRLYINGQYFGFYTVLDHQDEAYLDRNVGESSGDLFSWKHASVYNFEDLGTDPEPYKKFLEPKTNTSSPDYGKFVELIQAVNHAPDAQFVSAASRYLDLKLYLTLAAVENVLAEIDGFWDGVFGTNNLYLYRFYGQSLFEMMPTDKDLTFMIPQKDLPFPSDNPLARRLIAIPEYLTFYCAQVAKAAELLGGAGGWADQEIDRQYALIHDSAINDPHKQCIDKGVLFACGPAEFEQGVRDMHMFVAQRLPFVRDTLTNLGFIPPTGVAVIGGATLDSPNGGPAAAPGSIVRIGGSNLGDDVGAQSTPLPRSIGRSFVALNGIRVPILSMGSSEILVQVPWDIVFGDATLTVAPYGAFGNSATVSIVPAAPDILAVTHGDNSLVTPHNPASGGEVVSIYAAGLGAVDTPIAPGVAALYGPLVGMLQSPVVTAGEQPASVLCAGLTPGPVGLYQIQARLPEAFSC